MSDDFFYPRIPLLSWKDVLEVPDEVDGNTPLRTRVGIHLDCLGTIRKHGLKEAGVSELSQTDIKIVCDRCNLAVVIPRKVNRYGDLCGYLFNLAGTEAPDD